jgi:hypothetical protein
MMRVVTDDELEALEDATASYGHEPGMEAAAKDDHNTKLNALGTDYHPDDLPAAPEKKAATPPPARPAAPPAPAAAHNPAAPAQPRPAPAR